jgi:hypothetical protein
MFHVRHLELRECHTILTSKFQIFWDFTLHQLPFNSCLARFPPIWIGLLQESQREDIMELESRGNRCHGSTTLPRTFWWSADTQAPG